LKEKLKGKVDKKNWEHGYCPICGSEPDMAYLDKTGKRNIHCSLCGDEWSYPRLRCPFCGNQDQQKLGYFRSEQEEGFRVDFCRSCSRYLKTVDRRVFEKPAPMELEFLSTVHLDVLADQQGFK
jgi:FdhE protein